MLFPRGAAFKEVRTERAPR